jgi:hypothetical protein
MKVNQPRSIYLGLFLLLVILSLYYVSISAEILSVDDDNLFTYLYNLDGWSLKNIFVSGGSGYYYRPLLALTWLADAYLWGPHESFMHLENVLLHCANSILVYFITLHLAARRGLKSPYVPLVAALFFGLNPLMTESVNWISGRTDLLAGVFLLTAMLLLVKGLTKNSTLLICGAACAFFVATLAKETALFWFPASLFFVYCFSRDKDRPASDPAGRLNFHTAAPYLLLSLAPAGYFLLRHLALQRGDGGISLALHGVVAGKYEFFDKLRVILKVFGFYLKKLVFPLPLNFAIISVPDWYVAVGIAGLVLCCYLFYRRSVEGSLLLMGVCIISPALLVPLGRMAWTPVAERYLYMPVAFVVMALVILSALKSERGRIPVQAAVILVALLLAGSGYITYKRNLVWHKNLTLFQDCVEKSPDFAPAKNELARALQNSGKYEEAKKIFLSVKLPETDKYRIVSEINRANYMAADNDIKGGIAHLQQLHYTSSQPLYDQYLKALLFLYGKLEATQTELEKKHELKMKQIDLTKELQSYTGDTYLLYRIGQLYFSVKDEVNAAAYFQLAADKSPARAFYKEPARKLAARLRK